MTAPAQVQLSISTTSKLIPNGKLPAMTHPQITMNGKAVPQPSVTPSSPSGFQVLVIDLARDMTDPASILSNHYQGMFPDGDQEWSSTYPAMYDHMATQILSSGNVDQQRVIVVSYGMDLNAPPTPQLYAMLLELGAGPQLQQWQNTSTPGSESSGFISFPVNYVLVGASGDDYGGGTEVFANPGKSPATTTLTVTLSNPAPPPAAA